MKQLQGSGVLFAGAAVVLLAAQPVWSQATEVTAVRLSQADRGFNVVLETSTGNRPQIFTTKRDNALVAYIVNTQLRLPKENSFRQDNPAPGIASVVVTQLDPNSVRMVVTGTTSAPPNGQVVQRNAQGITLSFSPVSGTTALADSTPPAASPQPAATPAQPQPGQTTTAQTPSNVLVPNPEVTIDGVPVPSLGTTAQAGTPAPPPFLPRAIAPPVGDIAISNSDSSPSTIDLGTTERVPRLVLRDAPVREVLSLLARAAGLNLAFSTAPVPGQQGQPEQSGAPGEGPRISLDIENETVQDVFNYVLRITGLEANRTGRTIFVGTRLPNQARDVTVRSFRLNQVTVGVALNFLVGFGAESAVSRERVVTSVNAVPVGGSATPATQTQTTTETRLETQRVDFQDAIPLLRGLQALGDERTNSVTLVGTPRQIDIATQQLIQLDSRRRQVAVNVKIVDVNLLATEDFNTSFSFGIGDTFFSNDGGNATLIFGDRNPPTSTDVRNNFYSPPRIRVNNDGTTGTTDSDVDASQIIGLLRSREIPDEDGLFSSIRSLFPESGNGSTNLFQFPRNFLASLQAQVVSGNAKILTDPTLIVQEGQQANVNLTQEVVGNVTTTFSDTDGASRETQTITKERVGLTLSIRIERIDDNGFVALSVAPVVRAPQSEFVATNGDRASLISERSLNSGLVRLRDSQTLILSGIIQDADRTTVSKVPILGDIPILGALFRSTNRSNQRQEVIVLLTPQIIDDSERSSAGYNYRLTPDVRQMLERQGGSQVPGKNP